MPRKPGRPRTPPSSRRAPGSTSRHPPPGVKGSRAKPSRSKPSRHKVRAYRERMRKRGMKLIQIWVPDPESPYFAAEARRQARFIAGSPHEKEDQTFIDSLSEWKPD